MKQRYCLKWNNYQSSVTTTFKGKIFVRRLRHANNDDIFQIQLFGYIILVYWVVCLFTILELLAVEDFVDITLSAEGGALRAHKVVLSACSPYFRDILKVSIHCQKGQKSNNISWNMSKQKRLVFDYFAIICSSIKCTHEM